MYYYIYDIFTGENKYAKQIIKIESTLTNLGIAGKIYKLNVLKSLEDIIEDALINNVQNIIAVGNDQTLSKVANLVINKNIVTGIIPIGETNIVARALGINLPEEACKIISARKIAKLDLGKINDQYFLLAAEPENNNIICNFNNYSIKPKKTNETVGVYNINIDLKNFRSNPEDGIMEAVFIPQKKGWGSWFKPGGNKIKDNLSIFPVQKMTINHQHKPITISLDRQRVVKTPIEIEVLKRKLKIIVGKERVFN